MIIFRINTTISQVVSEDHKILVELACATALAPSYKPDLFHRLVPTTHEPATVVIVVCGVKTSLAELKQFKTIVDADIALGGEWDVTCNGEGFRVSKA